MFVGHKLLEGFHVHDGFKSERSSPRIWMIVFSCYILHICVVITSDIMVA